MNPSDLRKRLGQISAVKGAALCGVADLERVRSETNLLDSCYNTYTRGISIGMILNPAALADITDKPNRPYCEEYLKVNLLLDSIAGDIVSELKAEGFQSTSIPTSEVVDWVNLRGHLSHKLIGRYAGHGWIGRNALLVNTAWGAHVRYVTVLTDSPLEPNAPAHGECGTCRRCGKMCPAHAIGQGPGEFNLRACLNKLLEFNDLLGEPHYICGVCVSVCKGSSQRQA